MRSLILGFGLAIASYARASIVTPISTPTLTARAIVPTSAGQIGVNPVDVGLGTPGQYVGPIGSDTNVIAQDGSTTKWIGVNTEYLTDLTITTTVNNVPTTTASKVQISVVTATAAAEGLAIGDVTVLMSEALRKSLSTAVDAAAQACAASLKKRSADDFLACAVRAASAAAEGGEAFAVVDGAAWNAFALEVGANAPRIMADAFRILSNAAARNRFALFMGGLAAGGYIGVTSDAAKAVPGKLKFPGGKIGDQNKPTVTTDQTTSTTSSACDPKKTPDENSPSCPDDDCKGKDLKCTVGKDKGCRCVEWTNNVVEDVFDKSFMDEQQKVLKDALANLPKDAPPSCFVNTNGKNFEGKDRADPASWCVCTSGKSTGIYPTQTKTPACALDTMPTKTIEITNLPNPTGPVTSCRLITDTAIPTTTLVYCTCNDDKMHAQVTKTENGKAITTCIPPDAPTSTASPPPTIVPLPQDKPTCFGNPKDDPTFTKDELTKTVNKVCKELIDKKMKYEKDAPGGWTLQFFSGYTLKDPDSKTSRDHWVITVDIGVNERACPAGGKFIIDFVDMGLDKCKNHFLSIVDSCPNMTGGMVYSACASWTVQTYEGA